MGNNECLLDADRPTIHIKTDHIIQNKKWSRTLFWLKKNLFFTASLCIAMIMTFHLIQSSFDSTASSDKMFQMLREKLEATLPPHQAKLRPSPSYKYLDPDYVLNTEGSNTTVKGAFVVMAREEELYKVHGTMLDLERHFNQHHRYPWVIIGHTAFSRHFREFITTSTKSPVSFGVAPSIEFQEPYWIDIRYAEENAKMMVKNNIDKGESMHFRRMTRYNAGFIAFHPLLKNLDYYWKVQPGARYQCDIANDPFKRMQNEKKKLSFALTTTENHQYIYQFQEVVMSYVSEMKEYLVPVKNSIFRALLNAEGLETSKKTNDNIGGLGKFEGHWSNCMISNNFMVVSLDFLRSKEYNHFFDTLDQSGGFFYQRWGDSFPQTAAAALLLHRDEIVYDDIEGYTYSGATVCPKNIERYVDLKCTCKPDGDAVRFQNYCTPQFKKAIDGEL